MVVTVQCNSKQTTSKSVDNTIPKYSLDAFDQLSVTSRIETREKCYKPRIYAPKQANQSLRCYNPNTHCSKCQMGVPTYSKQMTHRLRSFRSTSRLIPSKPWLLAYLEQQVQVAQMPLNCAIGSFNLEPCPTTCAKKWQSGPDGFPIWRLCTRHTEQSWPTGLLQWISRQVFVP